MKTQLVTWIPVEERLPDAWSVPIILANDTGHVFIGGQNEPGDFHHMDAAMSEAVGITHWAEPLKHPDECGESPVDGNVLISCVNHACGSNGGDNFSAFTEDTIADLRRQLAAVTDERAHARKDAASDLRSHKALVEELYSAREELAKWMKWSGGRFPEATIGDVIHAEKDGSITLDDSLEIWNPVRAVEFVIARRDELVRDLDQAKKESASYLATIQYVAGQLADFGDGAAPVEELARRCKSRIKDLEKENAALREERDELNAFWETKVKQVQEVAFEFSQQYISLRSEGDQLRAELETVRRIISDTGLTENEGSTVGMVQSISDLAKVRGEELEVSRREVATWRQSRNDQSVAVPYLKQQLEQERAAHEKTKAYHSQEFQSRLQVEASLEKTREALSCVRACLGTLGIRHYPNADRATQEALAITPSEALRAVKLENRELGFSAGWHKGYATARPCYTIDTQAYADWLDSAIRRELQPEAKP